MPGIAPEEVRYIKLGPGGRWATTCFERGELHFGYGEIPHEPCVAGSWGEVESLVRQRYGNTRGKNDLRQIRDFYTLGPECLWITVENGHVWWCFAAPQVTWLGDDEHERHGARMRHTVSRWRNESVTGQCLRTDELSSVLTQVARYQGTICELRDRAQAYLLRHINGVEDPLVVRAREAQTEVVRATVEMIAQLHWADFETLADLIFARTGWQRTSRVGGTQKDVDLRIEQPTTGERGWVQVKSEAKQSVLDDYIRRFRKDDSADRLFFVCHSPARDLTVPGDASIRLLAGERLAEMVTKAGLFDWVVEHVQ